MLWHSVWVMFFRPCVPRFFNWWRIFLLHCFGSQVGKGSVVHSQACIWAPWNLKIGKKTCIGPYVKLYNPAQLIIGDNVTISQYSYICGGSHDISYLDKPFICAPIVIDNHVWVCADSFVKMGTHLKEGCVVGATSSVFHDVEEWVVVGGNPARYIKSRSIQKMEKEDDKNCR